MKVIEVIGRWEWLLSERGVSYKRMVGSGRLIEWPLPSDIDKDAAWNRLYGKSVEEEVVKHIVEPIKKEVVAKVGGGSVGRPRCELSSEHIARGEAMLEMGVSVSVMCRKLGIYRVKWYRAVSGRKKAPTS